MKKNKIKAVIFDMDGLIIDSEPIESKSRELLLKIYNKKPRPYPNGLLHIVGPSGSKDFLDFINQYEITESYEEIIIKKHEIFKKLLKENLSPMPGLIKLLKRLSKNNFKIGLASNRNLKFINIILEKLKIKKYFEVIISPSEKIRHKPFPDIYLNTAKELKVKPSECLVLEDSTTGIESAKSAGMKVIAVPNQYTLDHDFSKADLVTNSLKNVTITMLSNL